MDPVCRECGATAGAVAKFCAECGAKLPGKEADDVRKTVTALFCDLVGSTSLGERMDPENLRALLERYFAAMRVALERHGGTVEKFIGDAIVAFFGVPTTREDDALRAVRAAFDMLEALDTLNPELRQRWNTELAVRIGVNTGEVLVSGSAESTVGDAVNVAARLEQAAGPGEVLVGQTTWHLVRQWADGESVTPLDLKGKQQPVPAWRVKSVAGTTEEQQARSGLRSRLVGRERELALLRQSLERAEADRACQLFTVFGSAGVGKTRLTGEFLSPLRDEVRILPSRCLSYGDGSSLWPLREMLHASARLTGNEDDAEGRARLAETYGNNPDALQVTELLAPLAGLGGTPAALEEVQWAVRRFLEALAAAGPVIWMIEDLHWAEPALLAIVGDVVDWTRDAPVLVLCLARPEFLDDHPTWGGGTLNVTNVLLKPLSTDESIQLVEELLGGSGLPAEAMDRVVVGAGGTPLFLEQLLAMLVDDGILHRQGEGWEVSGDLENVTVPPTIGALLAARLERLSAGERQVLEAASVVGQQFYAGAAVELTALAPATVAAHLRSLARKEMIASARSDIVGEGGFTFNHILVRDSAYQALPKLRRAGLHERFARWLDKRAERLAGDADDFVAHHLAQAVLLRRSMGEIDEGTNALAEEAARRLAMTAWRLMATDMISAAGLYARAAELVPGTTAALDMRLRHGVALLRAQQFSASRSILDGVLEEAERSDERGLYLRARLAWIESASHTASALTVEEISRAAAEALEFFESTGNDEGIAHAYSALRKVLNLKARWEPMVEITDKAMHHAARAGDRYLFDESRSWRYAALHWGPLPAREGLELLGREARAGDISHLGYGSWRATEGTLLAFDDRPEEARAALAEARGIFEETHSVFLRLGLAMMAATSELVLGDDEAAERELVYMMEVLEPTGERSYLSTLAPLLAEVRWRGGDMVAAQELADMGRNLALDEDVMSQGMWRMVAAKVAASEGDFDRALLLASEAVEWIERSDQLSLMGDTHMGRAHVQRRASRPEEAETSLRRALDLYQAKGDIPGGRRAREALESMGAT